MKEIKVLGSGCTKCKLTASLIQEVADELKADITIVKVQDPAEIMASGVMSTPAVIIDDNIVHKGSVPSKELIKEWLI